MRSFELVQPDGTDLPRFTPGAHIKVQVPSGQVRKYSLCNAPEERQHSVITVKREAAGQGGSTSLTEDAREGHTLPSSVPDNAFPLVESAKAYLFIAGGFGITPIMAMIRSFGELPAVPWKLVYLTRSPEATAFRDELTAQQYKAQVRIHHDQGDAANAFDLWPVLEKPNSARVYCCGPRPLMDAVRDMTGHWSPANVHSKSFTEGGGVEPGDQPGAAGPRRAALPGRAFTLMLPTFLQDPRIALVVACDPPQAARAQFSRDFGAPVYDEVEQLAADPRVEAIYIASPHQFQAHPHRRGAWQACAAGKTDGGEIGPARAGWW